MTKTLPPLLLLALTLMSSCAQEKTDCVVTIKTKYGDMTAVLYDETPKHKENFIKLAKEHFFDGTLFHRVIKDFVIQGGDPDSKKIKPGERLGNGGPGYTVPAEINTKFYHEKGALSAARQSDPVNPTRASNGSQFYIVQGRVLVPIELEEYKIDQAKMVAGLQKFFQDPANKAVKDSLMQFRMAGDTEGYQEKILSLVPRIEKLTGTSVTQEFSPEKIKAYTTTGGAPNLDGQYTVFGKVVKGLEVIDKIAAIPVDDADRPIDDVSMAVSVDDVPRSKITALYGIHYPPEKEK
jgi:peptidyl-prolyl cis-trans isomerase B (cyclophilin B)